MTKRLFFRFAAIAAISLFCVGIGAAQTRAKDERAISEVTALRQKLIEAIRQRDQKALETFYADDFTHTHASGQVDDRARRIAALISGEPTIESAQVNEIKIRVYHKQTAVANGKSTIKSAEGAAASYRWTAVYVKEKGKWRVAASHATRLASE